MTHRVHRPRGARLRFDVGGGDAAPGGRAASAAAARPRSGRWSLAGSATSQALLLLPLLLAAAPLSAQVRPDSTGVPAPEPPTGVPTGAPTGAPGAPGTGAATDSLAAGRDSLAQAGQDSVPADTIYYNLPALENRVPAGFATGVWEWDREAILVSTANTLAELLAELPGVVQLLGGDYGAPAALSAFGSGSGGYRIVRDGFELMPLAGGVADLQRIGLGGVQSVRVERRGGEMLIELRSYRYDDGRPFSLVEAGTGQLDTNAFRGTYADPTALGGSVALSLERVDTRGYGADEGGSRTGYWFRYQLHAGDRGGVGVEVHRFTSKTEVPDYASSVRRSDLLVRGRYELLSGLVAEAYTGRSTYDVNDSREPYGYEGGRRVQHGVRLAAGRDALWARGAYRLHRGDDLPSSRLDASGGITTDVFGAYGHASQSMWLGRSVLGYGGGGWLGPVAGLTLFASWDGGEYAGRSAPVQDEVPPPVVPLPPPTPLPDAEPHVMERSLLRAGVSATRFGITLAGAGLRSDTDRHVPLGLELDRGSVPVAGRERYGVEAYGSIPVPILDGLRLEGSYQHWDVDGPYLPERIYRGAFVFHRTYLESENFELWWAVGVRGHDPSLVFVPVDASDPVASPTATVPFYQQWYGRITARILDVRLFFVWENLARRRNLQNFPDRLQAPVRTFFGLRWDMWN